MFLLACLLPILQIGCCIPCVLDRCIDSRVLPSCRYAVVSLLKTQRPNDPTTHYIISRYNIMDIMFLLPYLLLFVIFVIAEICSVALKIFIQRNFSITRFLAEFISKLPAYGVVAWLYYTKWNELISFTNGMTELSVVALLFFTMCITISIFTTMFRGFVHMTPLLSSMLARTTFGGIAALFIIAILFINKS